MTDTKPSTAALTLLRDKEGQVRSGAVLAEERADEAWRDYRRYADSARERWREHNELCAAIFALENQ